MTSARHLVQLSHARTVREAKYGATPGLRHHNAKRIRNGLSPQDWPTLEAERLQPVAAFAFDQLLDVMAFDRDFAKRYWELVQLIDDVIGGPCTCLDKEHRRPERTNCWRPSYWPTPMGISGTYYPRSWYDVETGTFMEPGSYDRDGRIRSRSWPA